MVFLDTIPIEMLQTLHTFHSLRYRHEFFSPFIFKVFHMDPMNLQKETFTLAEAAKVCGVNRVTMWRWVKANDLPATTTVGGHHRIRRSDLSVFMNQNFRMTGGGGTQKRILIVDDDPSIQKLMSRVTERAGYAVESCSNGFEAGIRVIRFNPHLIILDLFMPYLDGFQVCRQLKRDVETAGIKIIAISGNPTMENEDKALNCGADLFLEKPINKTKLVQQIALMLNSQTADHFEPYN